MYIPYLFEPNYRDSVWARQTLSGISQEASKRKYRLMEIDSLRYRDTDYDELFGNEKRMIIIAGTSISWIPAALSFFAQKAIDVVLISFDSPDFALMPNVVRMDYISGMETLLAYLSGCGKKHIALYGFNPNASADIIKISYFEHWQQEKEIDPANSVFYNHASLSDCYKSFYDHHTSIDAVICANDIVAISLIQRLRQDGIRVPDDLFVTAFGESLLSERTHPSITCTTLDHKEMGAQAVMLYAHLYRQKAEVNMSVQVRSRLLIRESTAMLPYAPPSLPCEDDTDINVDFYSDPEVQTLFLAEKLLNNCDEMDIELLRGIMHGATYEALSEKLCMTTDTLKYRRKRLLNIASCANTSELQQFLLFCKNIGLSL